MFGIHESILHFMCAVNQSFKWKEFIATEWIELWHWWILSFDIGSEIFFALYRLYVSVSQSCKSHMISLHQTDSEGVVMTEGFFLFCRLIFSFMWIACSVKPIMEIIWVHCIKLITKVLIEIFFLFSVDSEVFFLLYRLYVLAINHEHFIFS